jgi:hypothetical protein
VNRVRERRRRRTSCASLHDPGRALAIPCDASGRVDLDRLTERMRISYLGARAMLGREYGYPTVAQRH